MSRSHLQHRFFLIGFLLCSFRHQSSKFANQPREIGHYVGLVVRSKFLSDGQLPDV